MDRQSKPLMAVPISTKSAGKNTREDRLRIRRRMRRRRRQRLVLTAIFISIAACALVFHKTHAPQAKQAVQNVTPMMSATATIEKSVPDPVEAVLAPQQSLMQQVNSETSPNSPTPTATPVVLPTQAQFVAYEKDMPILYYSQSGDSLGVLAVRFGVEVSDITSTTVLPEQGFIPEGQLLLIPARLESTSSTLKLFPDTEMVNSRSALDFDVDAYVQQAGGYLSTYSETVYSLGYISGAEILRRVALDFSVHPRLLLALLEYQSGWVFGQPYNDFVRSYPMGLEESGQRGLYKQLVLAAGKIGTGYYGWREGTLVALKFPNGSVLRLAAELNCGTVGLMYFFSQTQDLENWAASLYAEDSFLTTYETMFGNPWMISQNYEPIFTPDVLQPEMILPFEMGITWSYTCGPHAAWGAAEVRAALDFAPPGDAPGCVPSNHWVVSSTPGLVVRSGDGLVVVDVDGDGLEQTGWNIIYLHVATSQRVKVGTWLETGDRIGHPSCEGGISTGTHLHIARKYNGEWVPAEGPLTFELSGWKAKVGSFVNSGWLINGDQVVRYNIYGSSISHITRYE